MGRCLCTALTFPNRKRACAKQTQEGKNRRNIKHYLPPRVVNAWSMQDGAQGLMLCRLRQRRMKQRCHKLVASQTKSHLFMLLITLLPPTFSPSCSTATVHTPQQMLRRSLCRTWTLLKPSSCFAPLPPDAFSSPQTTKKHFTQTTSKEKTNCRDGAPCAARVRAEEMSESVLLAFHIWQRNLLPPSHFLKMFIEEFCFQKTSSS